MLAAQVIEQLCGGHRQIAHSALEEVAGECRFRSNEKVGRLRPVSDLPEQGADPAEVLLVRALMGTYLGYGEMEHVLKVSGKR